MAAADKAGCVALYRQQEEDRKYMRKGAPASVFQLPRSHLNPAEVRPVEWPLPSMWSPQVSPSGKRPSSETPSNSWYERHGNNRILSSYKRNHDCLQK